jgi:hypothetical protein
LDIQRISSTQTAIGVAIEHLQLLKPLVGARLVIVLADRWYGTPEMLRAHRVLGSSVLIRRKSHRTRSRTPVRRSKREAPPKDGPPVQGTRPETQGEPHVVWEGTDAAGRRTVVSRWDEVHFQQDRDLLLSVIRVERPSARNTTRDPRVRWLLTSDNRVPLEQVPASYGLRFSEDHGCRFLTQDLRWTAARVRPPDPFLRWSGIVMLAFIPLDLARSLELHALLPWESTERPITPRQVRRVMPSMVPQVGTPTHPCQLRGKAFGRAKGFHPKSAPRYPVV